MLRALSLSPSLDMQPIQPIQIPFQLAISPSVRSSNEILIGISLEFFFLSSPCVETTDDHRIIRLSALFYPHH